ncbi:hypothetical protein GGR54DRAFT_626428 [Hypoxylon sp. NC1633]|nr:hypothetical protein GGR54DRAFT_626428 [Hypoxylon sp. NC1633]
MCLVTSSPQQSKIFSLDPLPIMSNSPTQPLGSPDDDRGPAFRAYIVVLTVVALIATILRFWSRSLHQPRGRQQYRFWWDDWVALASAITLIGQLTVTILLVNNGLGRHLYDLSEDQLDTVLKLLWVVYFIYDATLALTKASALLFFTRVFPHHKKTEWFNVAVMTTHCLNILWFLGIIFATIFLCNPIEKNWKPTIAGTCGPQDSFYLGSALPSVSIDLIILILPLPKVWRLQTSAAKKWGITLIFALGYGVIVASLGRLVTVLTESVALNTDITYKGIDIFYWTWAESPITILGISLPAMLRLSYHLSKAYLEPLSTKFSYLLSRTTLRSRVSKDSFRNDSQHTATNHASRPIRLSDVHAGTRSSGDSKRNMLHTSVRQENDTRELV